MQYLRSQVCVYIHIYSLRYRKFGWAKEIIKLDRVNETCQGNLSVCHFGHSSHRFFSPALEVVVSFSLWIENVESNEANMSGVRKLVACMGGIQETWPIRATRRTRSFPVNYITPKLKYGGSILLRNAGFKLQLTKPPGIKYQKTTVKLMKNFRCKKTHSAGKHNRRNHDTPGHRPLNQYYTIYHQTDLYFHVTQTDPEAPRWWQTTAETCRSRYIEQSSGANLCILFVISTTTQIYIAYKGEQMVQRNLYSQLFMAYCLFFGRDKRLFLQNRPQQF
jgi:hypothetical protein